MADTNAAVFGTTYFVEEGDVPCFAALRDMARRGDPLPLNSLLQFPTSGLPQPRVVTEWTSIRISSLRGAAAQAQVAGNVKNQQASVGAMAAALKQSNAQIPFASREAPLLKYQRGERPDAARWGVQSS